VRDRLSILLAGMVAGDPHQGGATWAVLQYVLGLGRLGHHVLLVEPVRELTPATARYFRDVVREFSLEDRAALLATGTGETVGLPYERLRTAARGADLLLNVSGMLDGELAEGPRTSVYLDLDPAFNQLWHVVDGIDMGFARHDRFVTVGLALGDDECPVPTCGLDWIPTPQPVVLDHWPVAPPALDGAITTVGNFRGYGSVEWEGTLYGQKVHSLRELFALPGRTQDCLVLAMAVHPDERSDVEALDRHGWQFADPREVAGTPGDYAAFIRASKAELGIAKSGYVRSRCGWFSDRSACYLATGRPVVAQETGFSRHLPAGEGLLAFTGVDDAADALAEVSRDPARHARAARAIAEEVFDSDRVLRALLERLS
jgi:hypothetical protein